MTNPATKTSRGFFHTSLAGAKIARQIIEKKREEEKCLSLFLGSVSVRQALGVRRWSETRCDRPTCHYFRVFFSNAGMSERGIEGPKGERVERGLE